MILAISIAAILAFVLVFHFAGIVSTASAVMATGRTASKVISDPEMDDLAKEKATQAAAFKMFGQSMSLMVRFAIVIGATFLPILVADLTGLASTSAVLGFLEQWETIIGATVIVGLGYFLWTRFAPR